MPNGIRKQRPQDVEIKLVRDKCSTCKKLFLAFRRTDTSLKTCDDCLNLKHVPNLSQEHTFEKIKTTCFDQQEQIRLSHENCLNVEHVPNSSRETNPRKIKKACLDQPEQIRLPHESCLNLNRIPDLSQGHHLGTIKETCSDQPEQIRLSHESSVSHSENNFNFPPVKKYSRPNNESSHSVTALPCKLGSYTIRHKILHYGYYLKSGDIVSVHNEGIFYYAQIVVFVESIFCEKYAALIWLLPTISRSNSAVGFDPFSFTYGFQDESFYDVSQLKFVMHPPTQFYRRFIPTVPKNSELLLGVKHKYKINCKRKS